MYQGQPSLKFEYGVEISYLFGVTKMRTFLILMVILGAASCATPSRETPTIPVNIYNLESGEKLQGEFYWTGVKGNAIIRSPDGTICNGEYLTEIGGSSSVSRSATWGSIYGWGVGHTTDSVTAATFSVPNTQVGSAILVCPNKNIIECEYVVNVNNHGSGYCRGKKQAKYKIIW